MAPLAATSLWKNQLITPAKRDQWHAELPLSNDVGDSCSALKCSFTHALTPGASQGSLLALNLNAPGHKYGQQAPNIPAGSSGKRILDFDVSPFRNGTLAVSSDGGQIKVSSIDWDTLAIQSSSLLGHQPPASMLHYHPAASELLLGLSVTQMTIWDLAKETCAVTLPGPQKGLWSACWSTDGRLLASTTKALTTQIWDPRSNPSAPTQEATGHQGIKASRIAWVSDHHLVSTGFSKMRERECCIYDARSFEKPVKTIKVDSNSGVLWPLVDRSRNLVYLAGRGDMSLKWVEVNPSLTITEGVAALPSPILGCALASPSLVNPMNTEINRLVLSSKDGIVYDAPVTVPRRQTLDFHPELFPPVTGIDPALSGTDWIKGQEATMQSVNIGPKGPEYSMDAQKEAPSLSKSESLSETAPAKEHTQSPTPMPQVMPLAASQTVSQQHEKIKPPKDTAIPEPRPTTETADDKTLPSSNPAPQTTPAPVAAVKSHDKPVTHWSRSFLIGKTPLKPAFEGLSGLSTTAPPEQPMLRCNPSLLVFPLSGAGGRIAAHPPKKTGRLPSVMPAFVCGASMTAFELDPFDHARIYVACDDSKIRIFRAPEEGLQEDNGTAEQTLHDATMDRISQIRAHPTTKNLLLSVSDDRGNPTLRFWDLSTGHVQLSRSVKCTGISNARWSPNGSRVLLACKDHKLRILDPRSSDEPIEGPSHDSPRPVHPLWLSSEYVLTTGFARSAREIQLYRVTPNEIKPLAKQPLEISPAPLFPHYDADTGILFLHSKGERIASAYEIRLDQTEKPFVKLPAFEHGTLQLSIDYLPKKYCDTTKVEVAEAYRLTGHTIERIGFCIPRARVEYFQDDVYPPTPDVECSVQSIEEWLSGGNKEQPLVDLNSQKMPLLSSAPPTKATISTRDKIAAGPRKTDDERAKEEMNHLWNKAQQDGAESESDDDVPASGRIPEDDDW